MVVFKSCLGAVWGRSLSSIALRYESWGCPVQYSTACCQDDWEVGGRGKRGEARGYLCCCLKCAAKSHIKILPSLSKEFKRIKWIKRKGSNGVWGGVGRICRTINLTMVIILSIIHRRRHDEHFLQHHHDHHEEGMFIIIIVISGDRICYKQYKQCLYKIIAAGKVRLGGWSGILVRSL